MTTNTSTHANGPEKKFSAGAISATIWNNGKQINGQDIDIRSVQLQRSYKDKDGSWKNSSSLRINDIPKARLVLEKVYEYMTIKEDEITYN